MTVSIITGILQLENMLKAYSPVYRVRGGLFEPPFGLKGFYPLPTYRGKTLFSDWYIFGPRTVPDHKSNKIC